MRNFKVSLEKGQDIVNDLTDNGYRPEPYFSLLTQFLNCNIDELAIVVNEYDEDDLLVDKIFDQSYLRGLRSVYKINQVISKNLLIENLDFVISDEDNVKYVIVKDGVHIIWTKYTTFKTKCDILMNELKSLSPIACRYYPTSSSTKNHIILSYCGDNGLDDRASIDIYVNNNIISISIDESKFDINDVSLAHKYRFISDLIDDNEPRLSNKSNFINSIKKFCDSL